MSADEARQKRVLVQVLLWNALLFFGLIHAGWIADSSALLANALDNGADAAVYLISFLAIGRRPAWKRGAAAVSGVMLLLFAAGVIVDVVYRWRFGAEPMGPVMMALALVAAAINYRCLVVPRRLRSGDINMRAAETFSFNDFVSNGGILVAGVLVWWLHRPWPDLLAGALIALFAIKGGVEILVTVRAEKRADRK